MQEEVAEIWRIELLRLRDNIDRLLNKVDRDANGNSRYAQNQPEEAGLEC